MATRIYRGSQFNLRRQIEEVVTAVESDVSALEADVSAIKGAPVVTGSATGAFSAELVLTAGANITLTPGAGTLTVAATGGSGSGNSVTATVDFGSSFTHIGEVVVTGQAWVTANSEIVVTPITSGTDQIEIALLSFQPVVHSLVAGVGFTLTVYSPIEAKGTYSFSCVGV